MLDVIVSSILYFPAIYTVYVPVLHYIYMDFSSAFMHFISTLPLHGTLDITFSSLPYKHPLCDVQPAFPLFPQDGWTAILLAARYGHKKVLQELCETFGADFLHRKKVRAMKTLCGSERLSKLCMCRF